MIKDRKWILILAALVAGLCFHGTSAWAEGGAPGTVVKNFARAYFMLDASMADYLSESARMDENEADTVTLYLEEKAAEARDRGYAISYLQMRPVAMKTTVLNMDDSSAEIQFEAINLRSINPLFRMVGFVFGLLEEHPVRGIITLVKEDGGWKIGPGAFGMPL